MPPSSAPRPLLERFLSHCPRPALRRCTGPLCLVALLLAVIEVLDARADASGLSDSDWTLRFSLKRSLVQIHCLNEIYWRQRGSINWMLKGDSPLLIFLLLRMGGGADA